jgi:hypothetical protein
MVFCFAPNLATIREAAFFGASGRQPQYQWQFQQHWQQRQLVEFYRELINERLEPEHELQQRQREPQQQQ